MSTPPSGTITFLFTDIESSTRLWQEHPERMKANLARHDGILRDCVEQNEGYVFKTMGDAFYAAFATALQGVKAASEAQQALSKEDWEECIIKVRMGLHTGDAEQRDNDYFGNTLNRAARLMSAGHGGQILLSMAAQELVQDKLPDGAALADLGEHRLKDLARPEHIFQLLSPGLPVDFLPLKTLDTSCNNLPVQFTSFIGREKEMAEVRRLLNEKRLVTITGPGGTGKTRLSIQAAAELLDAFPNGVWLVELAPLADPALVPQAVASALEVREQPRRSLQDVLIDYLREKSLLLLLDNCEHLIEACAALAEALLQACPGLKILASSREALGIPGEAPFRLPSLSIPDARSQPSIQALLQYEAVRLFSERAVTALPTFTITDTNASALAQICRRLDGIPLAIELAAARVRMLSVEQIAARLNDCFRLLTGGSRTALPRQQTLQALIDWSYDLLPDPERILLLRLSVFAGGLSLKAAEAVGADQGAEMEVLDLLTQLANKSLVVVEYEKGEASRYHLLETVRQYASQKLVGTGEGAQIRTRHLAYYLKFAEEAAPYLLRAEQMEWLARLEREHDNLRAALEWALDGVGADPLAPPEAALRLPDALWRFWLIRGYHQEGHEAFEMALGSPDHPSQTLARAWALLWASEFEDNFVEAGRLVDESLSLCRILGDRRALSITLKAKGARTVDFLEAKSYLEESLSICRELGNQWGIATALNVLANRYAEGLYDATTARHYYEESLALHRETGDRRGKFLALKDLGFLTQDQGNLPAAQAYFLESLSLAREVGDKGMTASITRFLGVVALGQGEASQALKLTREALTIARETGEKNRMCYIQADQGRVARFMGNYQQAADLLREPLVEARQTNDTVRTTWILTCLGELARLRGEHDSARAYYTEAVGIAREMMDRKGMAWLLEESAALRAAQGEMESAARLFGAAQALRTAIQMIPLPIEQAVVDKNISLVKVQMDEAAYDAAWAEGQKMNYEQAVACMVELLEPHKG